MPVTTGNEQHPPKVVHEEYSPKTILDRLNEFRKDGKFCDVKIVVNGAEFLAHKVILAAFSPYLEGLFSKGYTNMHHFILELNCVEDSLVELLLEYAYTTDIEFTESNIVGLLHLAKFFEAKPLFDCCCRYMEDHINPQNSFEYYKLAKAYSHTSLKAKAKECIQKNFSVISEQSDFLELEAGSLVDICESCAVDVDSFDAIVRWIQYKRPKVYVLLKPFLQKILQGGESALKTTIVATDVG